MKNCVNCKYSRDVGSYLACYGQKNAPKVNWDDVCSDWKSEHITNADRVRAMTDEELAELVCDHACMLCPIEGCEGRMEEGRKKCKQHWLDWLKQEVDENNA